MLETLSWLFQIQQNRENPDKYFKKGLARKIEDLDTEVRIAELERMVRSFNLELLLAWLER